jgi:hypothetical protein
MRHLKSKVFALIFLSAVLAVFLLFPCLMRAQGQPLTDEQWVTTVYHPSVLLLFKQGQEGSMDFGCTVTAFEKTEGKLLASDTYLMLTAAHCVNRDTRGYYYLSADTVEEKKFYKAKLLYTGNAQFGDDFAVLEVKTNDKIPVIALGEDSTSVFGEEVINISSPLGLGKQTLIGRVSSPKMERPMSGIIGGKADWTGYVLLQLNGITGGASGSSVTCVKQRAICSIIVGTIDSTTVVAAPVSRFKAFYVKAKAGQYTFIELKKDNPFSISIGASKDTVPPGL